MFYKILCPTDLSEESIISIRKGVELATHFKSEIILLNVRPDFMSKEEMVMLRTSTYDFLEEVKDIAKSAKEIMMEELRRAGGSHLDYKLILREGDPTEEIIEVAEELECDLIVVTTTGRNHLIEHIRGSDTEQMVKVSHVPMLVLPIFED